MNLIPEVGRKNNSDTMTADCHWHPITRAGVCTFFAFIGIFVFGLPLDLVFDVRPGIGAPIGAAFGFIILWLFFAYAPRLHPLYGMGVDQRHAVAVYDNCSPAAKKEIGPRPGFVKLIRNTPDPHKVEVATRTLACQVDERNRVLAKTAPPPPPSKEELETEEFVNSLNDRADAIKHITRQIESGVI